ncbi:ubiquinone biosynthesis protein COQ9, mitochondrial-like isoform X3 [Ornithodoros turicata]|uniref:ubiquinone biosynthesis protein COQ9, mitochondrial-like isoform X3 n=1 Tax=Ornithodoros turicata TaxID=34597 RepID=UPI003139C961
MASTSSFMFSAAISRNLTVYSKKLLTGVPHQGVVTRIVSYSSRPAVDYESHEAQSTQSKDDQSQEQEITDVKSSVLRAALNFVPEHGWTRQAIAAGADSLGLSSVSHGLFPSGGVDLITFYYLSCNEELERYLALVPQRQQQRGGKGTNSTFIKDAVLQRILMIAPHKDTWPQAMGKMALPTNVPRAFANLGDVLNIIWHYAGDHSVDMSWYTKRLALAALYKSTELVFVQDSTPEYSQTLEFLDRRMKEFAAFDSCTTQLSQAASTAKDVVESGFATLKNMMGMNTR